MKKDNLLFVQHILECIEKIEEYTKKCTEEDFLNRPLIQDAVLRNLEIIGEATKNISQDFKEKHQDIPWRKMAGLRDILIHMYLGIDLEMTWNVILYEFPSLKEKLQKIKKEQK